STCRGAHLSYTYRAQNQQQRITYPTETWSYKESRCPISYPANSILQQQIIRPETQDSIPPPGYPTENSPMTKKRWFQTKKRGKKGSRRMFGRFVLLVAL
ncbi:hypothetical protein AKJ16_DCAP06583, partial [Drosera capensis]